MPTTIPGDAFDDGYYVTDDLDEGDPFEETPTVFVEDTETSMEYNDAEEPKTDDQDDKFLLQRRFSRRETSQSPPNFPGEIYPNTDSPNRKFTPQVFFVGSPVEAIIPAQIEAEELKNYKETVTVTVPDCSKVAYTMTVTVTETVGS